MIRSNTTIMGNFDNDKGKKNFMYTARGPDYIWRFTMQESQWIWMHLAIK